MSSEKQISIKSSSGKSKELYSEHQWDDERLMSYYETSVDSAKPEMSQGLSKAQAQQRLARDGPNQLTPPPKKSLLTRIFITVFKDAFMVLLLIAAALCWIAFGLSSDDLTNLYLAIALIFIVAFTSTITLYQEGQASDVMSGFANLLPPSVLVRRDGQTSTIGSTELVVGDIVLLNTGDKVPADVKLLSASQLKIDHSSLTGESVPVSMQVQAAHEEFLEAKNIAFSGTLVTAGLGCGVVIRTGDRSYVGSIARLASTTTQEKSTLTKEVEAFVRFIAILALVMSTALFIVQIIRTGTSLQSFIDAIVVAFIVVIVANVPQGLPSAVAGALTIAAQKLAKRNVFVKSLNSIETLGSVSVIASDKTGTLTQNVMTVTSVWCDSKSQMVSGNDIDDADEAESIPDKRALLTAPQASQLSPATGLPSASGMFSRAYDALVFVSALCNQADVVKAQQDKDDAAIPMSRPASIAPDAFTDEDQNDTLVVPSRRASQSVFVGRPMPGANLSVAARKTKSRMKQPVQPQAQRVTPLTSNDLKGNASDIALYLFAEKTLSVAAIRKQWSTAFQVPFSSARKFMMTVMRPPTKEQRHRIVCLKGAPERVLNRCDKVLVNGETQKISAEMKDGFLAANARYMKQGRRVLAMAISTIEIPQKIMDQDKEKEYLDELLQKGKLIGDIEDANGTSQLTLIGCAALEDPPKVTVPSAVLKCRQAGIRVVMVTGDHPATAASIARQCNILGKFNTREEAEAKAKESSKAVNEEDIGAVVVTGHDLKSFTDADWDRVLSKPEIVFARTSPLDKLEIVKQFQQRGEIVAVTGDGVNDSPALKRADVGVAMGISGSEVAKDAGDLVLIDDEFFSLVAGIEQGRIIFDNLIKVVAYTLTHLMPELFGVLLALLFNGPYGMTSLMILLIDLLTEAAPALSLSYEGPEENVMQRPPRDLKKDRLVSKPLLFYAYILAGSIELLACLIAWGGVFVYHNIGLSDVFGGVYLQEGAPEYPVAGGEALSEARQLEIVAAAQTAYFFTTVLSQFWHVWMCKTRLQSIVSHGLFGNKFMNLGVVCSVTLLLVASAVPAMNTVFGSRMEYSILALYIVPSLGAGVLLWTFNEARKYVIRNYPDSLATKILAF